MYHRHSSDIVAVVPKSTINDIPLNANQSASRPSTEENEQPEDSELGEVAEAGEAIPGEEEYGLRP